MRLLVKLVASTMVLLLSLTSSWGAFARPGSSDDPPAPRDVWQTSVVTATERAQAEHKDLLLNFTGSDWCSFCIQLDKEVFAQAGFDEQIARDFICVKLDFPRDSSQMSPATIEQNAEWQKRLAIEGYPTIALLDEQQRPYAFTGYREGGLEAYLAHLQELRGKRVARDAALTKAADAEGSERARLLDEALQALDAQIAEVYYADLIKEIIELDADNALGLRAKYNEARERELQRELLTDIAMVARLQNPETAIAFIDEAIQAVPLAPATRYRVLLTKLDLLRKIGETTQAEALVDEMMAIQGLDQVDIQKLIVKKVLLVYGSRRKAEAYALLDQRIGALAEHQHLLRAKAELLASDGDYPQAIRTAEAALAISQEDPNLSLALHQVKADALVASDQAVPAIEALDAFADNPDWPVVLRAEAMLHKALILRETNRRRAAILAENKAVEICDSPADRAQIQRLVDQLRKRFDQ